MIYLTSEYFFFIFLGYVVGLQVFSNYYKSQKKFQIYIEKNSTYKWTYMVLTFVAQGSTVHTCTKLKLNQR